jgi:probable O-glycosylation ligase (exosortase A-associated)
MCIVLPFSLYFDDSYRMWNRVIKIDLMVLVAMIVLYSRKHIISLAWVLAGSLGFYGVKGGLFTLATGGSYRVWGPEGSYIAGNNEVALALVMIIPLMRFLHITSESLWIKRGLMASMLLCAAAALGSQSRGALLAIAAMGTVFWWRSDKKLIVAILLAVFGVALLSFMPESWWDRMSTIRTYDQDTSAGGRINAWWMAWNLAKDNFFGGGFSVAWPELFARYAPDPTDVHAAHSIYFMVLGELGFVGLILFMTLWIYVWRSAGRLRIQGKRLPQTMWLSHLGAMCQVSLAGYAVGGAFLSLSYYDLPYNILILVVLGCRWMDGKEWVVEEGELAQRQAALDAKDTSKTKALSP